MFNSIRGKDSATVLRPSKEPWLNFRSVAERYGLLPIVTVSALAGGALFTETRPVQAAEIAPTASWTQGVETLHREALTVPTEMGATYVLMKDGSEKWISVKPTANATSITLNLKNEVDQLQPDLEADKVKRICNFHTHPLFAGHEIKYFTDEQLREEQQKEEGTTASIPPSGRDVSIFELAKVGVAYKGYNFDPDKNYINAVADPGGVWYHRIASEEDYRQFPTFTRELEERRALVYRWDDMAKARVNALNGDEIISMVRTIKDFNYESEIRSLSPEEKQHYAQNVVTLELMHGNNSFTDRIFMSDSDRRLNEEYKEKVINAAARDGEMVKKAHVEYANASLKGAVPPEIYHNLQEAYVRNGAILRYVPYSKISQEVACAGVDWKADGGNK